MKIKYFLDKFLNFLKRKKKKKPTIYLETTARFEGVSFYFDDLIRYKFVTDSNSEVYILKKTTDKKTFEDTIQGENYYRIFGEVEYNYFERDERTQNSIKRIFVLKKDNLQFQTLKS